jgi:hypothetical protein
MPIGWPATRPKGLTGPCIHAIGENVTRGYRK